MTDNLSWKEKFNQVRVRYNQLYNVRHSAVQADINDLIRKIKEHQKAQESVINEINEENKFLKKEINDINSAQRSISQLKLNIDCLKNKLRVVDTILNTVLEYRFLVVKCIGQNHYRIHCVDNDDIVFELKKGPKSTEYHPIKIPSSQLFFRFKQEVQVPDLRVFCNELQIVLNQ